MMVSYEVGDHLLERVREFFQYDDDRRAGVVQRLDSRCAYIGSTLTMVTQLQHAEQRHWILQKVSGSMIATGSPLGTDHLRR